MSLQMKIVYEVKRSLTCSEIHEIPLADCKFKIDEREYSDIVSYIVKKMDKEDENAKV